MNLTEYNKFTEDMRLKLAGDDRVLCLVALGSMAQQDYQPDEWSDHDFFVITIHGVQEDMRRDLSWLPRADDLVFYFRETEHGIKALYHGGHLLEFAIFNEDELQLARLNRYRVLLDKAEIAPRLEELALTTQDWVAQGQTDPNRRLAEFLMNLFVGVGRYARGERLSGHQFIKTYALTHLLRLLAEFHTSEDQSLLDNLDPFRRFERVFPRLGAEINGILAQNTLLAAEGLLALAVLELRPFLSPFPDAAVTEVQRMIAKARQETT
ncbi:MAG: hypothetical protein H6657_04720 [Ardenticatenaceae bacterium]|nr:hypothetical protein [Anaerolineales bacterium]MCB8976709.1 hypothetical protein [Ardenticatenaceae bacterium]